MTRQHQSPVWHPFTQHALEPAMKKIVRTEGAYLIDEDGRSILDAISSWWVITHGHRHPVIMDAIRKATETFDQIIFAEYTHEPAENLARRLIEVAPSNLAHVFYSDSGSTAVEVSLKMALGFFRNDGRPRSRIAVMEHSYHGDTIGAMSAGARGAFNAAYEPLLFQVDVIPCPTLDYEQDAYSVLDKLCSGKQIAALLIEPLVLGAGGMKMYQPHVLAEFKRIVEKYGTLLIVDEVMTGWGRTGTLFACEQAALTPDILCLSKGITGGALPLAVTLCSKEIFDAHFSVDRNRTFFHSSSYTANPIACAAAVANLEIWKNEPVAQRVEGLAEMLAAGLTKFRSDRRFTDVRQTGTIVALDLDTKTTGYLSDVGPKLRKFFRQKDILIRPLGNVIYVMPPYCTTQPALDKIYDAIDEAADAIGALS